jgi:hypothetical protein
VKRIRFYLRCAKCWEAGEYCVIRSLVREVCLISRPFCKGYIGGSASVSMRVILSIWFYVIFKERKKSIDEIKSTVFPISPIPSSSRRTS